MVCALLNGKRAAVRSPRHLIWLFLTLPQSRQIRNFHYHPRNLWICALYQVMNNEHKNLNGYVNVRTTQDAFNYWYRGKCSRKLQLSFSAFYQPLSFVCNSIFGLGRKKLNTCTWASPILRIANTLQKCISNMRADTCSTFVVQNNLPRQQLLQIEFSKWIMFS